LKRYPNKTAKDKMLEKRERCVAKENIAKYIKSGANIPAIAYAHIGAHPRARVTHAHG